MQARIATSLYTTYATNATIRRASDIWDDNHVGEEEAAEEEGRGQEKTEEGRTRGD